MSGAEREAWLERLGNDWRTAELSALDAALCAYAEKLTPQPAQTQVADVERLRALGLDDSGVHHVIQTVGFFNYINRVADAVHVDVEPGMRPYPGEVEPSAAENARASHS